MKKLFAMLVLAVMLFTVACLGHAEGDLMLFPFTGEFDMPASEWIRSDERKTLLLISVAVDIYNAGYTTGLKSDIALSKAYMGVQDNLIMIAMPTEKQNECFSVVIDPSYGGGMIQLLNGSFDSANVKNGIQAATSSSWGFKEDMINWVLDTVLKQAGVDVQIGSSSKATAAPRATATPRTIVTSDTSYTLVEKSYDVPSHLLSKQYTLGENSKEVLEIKQRMQKLGYFKAGAELSGNYNGTMQERIRQFQRDYGIGQTGEINYVFLKTLYGKEASEKIAGK